MRGVGQECAGGTTGVTTGDCCVVPSPGNLNCICGEGPGDGEVILAEAGRPGAGEDGVDELHDDVLELESGIWNTGRSPEPSSVLAGKIRLGLSTLRPAFGEPEKMKNVRI